MPQRGKPESRQLAEYRRKRSAESTPEPFSAARRLRPGLFVVHKHAARQLHYDLRLEMGGVLQSWAVPKGPSLDPQTKRLAMKVEEHPLEYADFEGIIPKDNYGAGPSIVWDRGRWVPDGDPEHGLEKGKLLFDLYGHKLKGRWTLFKTKGGEKHWLLMKKPDAYAATDGDALPEASVHSNLTVEELGEGRGPRAAIRAALARLKTPAGRVDAARLDVMLATAADASFTRDGWLFELKYDGYRVVAAAEAKRPLLRYRRGQDVTALFPELTVALAAMPYERIVMDAELVVLDDRGRPSFHRLQRRVALKRTADVDVASVRQPATLFVFDLLGFEEFDLRGLPLIERKRLLEKLLPPAGPLRYSEHIERRGEEMFEQVTQMRLEGIVAKRAASPYRAGRSTDWYKIRAMRSGDFVVVGYTRPRGSRSGFGALYLAARAGEGLLYVGSVGTGFTAKQIAQIHQMLAPSRRDTPPCSGDLPREAGQTWVEPELVCEVRFKEWTENGQLRHPSFLRLRDDKGPEDCVLEEGLAAEPDPEPAPESTPALEPTPQPAAPALTNLDKVFWPEERYTKGDLIDYYRTVSAWLLPYLRDRPVVLTRYPDGIAGKSFFQKDAPSFAPKWVRTETIWSEGSQRDIHYFICNDEATLLYLINMGSIPLHIWASRLETVQMPDWCVLDLDPKGAPFRHVVRLALAMRELCEEIELDVFVKTTGSTGLHVMIPLGRRCTHEASRLLALLLASVVVERHADIATTARALGARKGKVYIDCLQNGHGKLIVAPFSVRPLPGATVSTPLSWSEVGPRLRIDKFTIRSVPRRLEKMADPLLPVLDLVPDVPAALNRLESRTMEGKRRHES